jgi:gamma-glutamylcyclotransferase (GGCT)/AIG2-like uncharacterized protein YtfP
MPLLFSYGTLQEDSVQLAIFGRRLEGQRDALVGFECSPVDIENPQFVATSGKSRHVNAEFNGRGDSRVSGTAFLVTDSELAVADDYERAADYVRRDVTLESGRTAWVYVSARSGTP